MSMQINIKMIKFRKQKTEGFFNSSDCIIWLYYRYLPAPSNFSEIFERQQKIQLVVVSE